MNVFKWLGGLLGKAFSAAKKSGLTDEVMGLALDYAKAQVGQAFTNNTKRDRAVSYLVGKGIKESIARFAVESAVQIIKEKTK